METIEEAIDAVICLLPASLKAYNEGEKGLIGLFMAHVIKRGRCRFDPHEVYRVLQEKLDYETRK